MSSQNTTPDFYYDQIPEGEEQIVQEQRFQHTILRNGDTTHVTTEIMDDLPQQESSGNATTEHSNSITTPGQASNATMTTRTPPEIGNMNGNRGLASRSSTPETTILISVSAFGVQMNVTVASTTLPFNIQIHPNAVIITGGLYLFACLCLCPVRNSSTCAPEPPDC